MARKVTDQELADARLLLALEILDSDNAVGILEAMQDLIFAQADRANYLDKKKSKKKFLKREAKQWQRAADEFFTVLMCAVYQQEDSAAEEGN